MDVKFPHIKVKLIGEDGNAFSIIGRVKTAMRRGGCTQEEMQAFHDEATKGDYNNLLQTVMATVNVEGENEDDYQDDDLYDYDEGLDEDFDEEDDEDFDEEDDEEDDDYWDW